jgi:hypothetical protein
MGTTHSGAHAVAPMDTGHAAAVAALGRHVHDLRSARGFSLQEFALLSGLSAPALSSLERGETQTPIATLFAAAHALALPVAALFPPAEAAPAPVAPAPVAPAHAHAPAHPVPAPAHVGPAADAAPRGYVPLEVPALWEPPAGSPADEPAYARADSAPRPEPQYAPQPQYVPQPQAQAVAPQPPPQAAPPQPVAAPRDPYVRHHPVPQAVAAPRPAAAAPVPRTFADLRVGVLADRAFATLPEFAVAAVVEGGHPVSVVASVFRVPTWRLEAWVRDGVEVPRPATSFRRPS